MRKGHGQDCADRANMARGSGVFRASKTVMLKGERADNIIDARAIRARMLGSSSLDGSLAHFAQGGNARVRRAFFASWFTSDTIWIDAGHAHEDHFNIKLRRFPGVGLDSVGVCPPGSYLASLLDA